MIISIRGTNGSGKSTIMRRLVEIGSQPRERPLPPPRRVYASLGSRLPEAYELYFQGVARPVYVLGPYHLTQCGGCDSIIPFDLIPKLIEQYAAKGHVVFEGVIVGSIYGQVGTLMERWGKDSVGLFLSTSQEECIRRVQARRDGRSDGRVFNPKNLMTKFGAVQSVRKRMLKDNIVRVEDVSSDDAVVRILSLLGEGSGKVAQAKVPRRRPQAPAVLG